MICVRPDALEDDLNLTGKLISFELHKHFHDKM